MKYFQIVLNIYKRMLVKLLLLLSSVKMLGAQYKQPNIVLILADDLGFNDVSYHGSNQIPTPNIDALAYNGIILERFYTAPTCTPSRTALLTGNYPIRYGLQGYPMVTGENKFIPLDTQVLPEHLKKLGYKTHLVGKWHLGFSRSIHTPTRRGFDSHFGYWGGYIGYINHTYTLSSLNAQGLDMRDNLEADWSVEGKYATDVFTEKATDIIKNHKKDEPLFLMLAHLAPHSGDRVILEVPDKEENDRKYGYIHDEQRRLFAGMVDRLDESVGEVLKTLRDEDIINNTIVIFMADNGAETIGDNRNYGSNWPLRGQKFTTYEGGVRGVAIIFSPLLKQGIMKQDIVHMSDFLPTLYDAAGGNVTDLGELDGVNQWQMLTGDAPSPRDHILLNIDETQNTSAIIGFSGRYKLVNGSFIDKALEQYLGESGRDSDSPPYNTSSVINSLSNSVMRNNILTDELILNIRSQMDLQGCRSTTPVPDFTCTGYCLFNLVADPCETTDIADKHPEIVQNLSDKMSKYWRVLVPRPEIFLDPLSNPKYFNNTWAPWLDYSCANVKIIPPFLTVFCLWVSFFLP